MSAHTPGPWRWEINVKGKNLQLCGGEPTYDKTVLDFARWGMSGATARFRTEINFMITAAKFAQVVPGREHHAEWFQALVHPDAQLIAAAPDLLASLEELVGRRERVATQHGLTGVSATSGSDGRYDRARAAIAKARGGQ